MAAPQKHLVVEFDHYLRILAVMLDPEAPDEHRRAVADFFAHDIPDFEARSDRFRRGISGLFPATVEFAADQRQLAERAPDADIVIVESLRLDRELVGRLKPAAIIQKFGSL